MSLNFIRTLAIVAGTSLCLGAPALGASSQGPAVAPAATFRAVAMAPGLAPRLPASQWPMALLCRATHPKVKPDGTELSEKVSWGEWSYIALAPSIDGHFVYARGPLYHGSDDKPPKDDYEQTNVVAVFNADGSSAGKAVGNCDGRSILQLQSAGQTR